jgi:diguanylate cyclase (GGDEF)-like protein
MTSETADFFETLYDLLKGNRPNMGKALSLVEAWLEKGACSAEQDAAQEQLLKFLTSFKQFFSKNQESRNQVAELIRIIESEGMVELSVLEEVLRSVMPLMPAHTQGYHGVNHAVPASFMDRVRHLLPVTEIEASPADSINNLLTRVGQEKFSQVVGGAVEEEKLWQERLVLMGRSLSAAYSHDHLVDEKTTMFFQGNPVDGTLKSSQKLESLVRKQLLALHRIAGSLGARMEEGREKAANLKSRVDQLEEAVTLSQESLFIDPETAIPGRASFTAHLHRHLERAMHLGELFSLALVHVQDFGDVLKRLDREEANHFVKIIASLIRSQLHDGDFLARLGVDRFALIFPATTQERSSEVSTNIGLLLNGTEYKLSKGVSTLQARVGALSFEAGMTAHDMLTLTDNLADSAMETQVVGGAKTLLNVREA